MTERMRTETLRRVLKYAECGHFGRILGDWFWYVDSSGQERRGPALKSVLHAQREGFVDIDPIGRVTLTQRGTERLTGASQSVVVRVKVPAGREVAFRALVADFLG